MQLIQFSDNFFGEMLVVPHPLDPMQELTVTEPSNVFNVVLHAVYNLNCAQYNPSDEDVMAAIDALSKYSVALNKVAVPATPLFALITSRLGDRDVTRVLQFYALAGHYGLNDLAVHCSQYLLPLRAREIPPPLAEQMGVRYLKHLIFLRLDRVEKLREILSQPPQEHLPIPQCSSAQPAALARAWSLTGAYFMWEARAGELFDPNVRPGETRFKPCLAISRPHYRRFRTRVLEACR